MAMANFIIITDVCLWGSFKMGLLTGLLTLSYQMVRTTMEK